MYHGTPGATHYSALSQINTRNVQSLQVAWTFDARDTNSGYSEMQSNPLIIQGRLVFSSPKGRIICLDAASGKELWVFDPTPPGIPSMPHRSRGVSYWRDERGQRVLFTYKHHLLALDFVSGELIRSFGNDGRVDLRLGLGRDPDKLTVASVAPGAIYQDLVIIGTTGATPGHIRAYDVRSGQMRWIFHTIPHPGEPGHETWPADAWQRALGANSWPGMTIDTETGTVFVPTASAGMEVKDFYGADRIGDNLFANSVVALDATTGKRRWHFQTVRHDLWDRDLPAQPTLVTVRRNGVSIPALAQVTKSGFLFVLDRRTGESLFELEERAVPASDVPGEVAAKTQIFPRLPLPFTRQELTADMLTRRTPEARRAALEVFSRHRSGGQFVPPSLEGTIMFPGTDGGAEWGGASYDPETGLLYVNSNEVAWFLKLNKRPPPQTGITGRALFLSNCASCHGADRGGSSPQFPSLLDVGERLSHDQLVAKIREGGGRMPGFRHIEAAAVASIANYLISGAEAPPDRHAAPGHKWTVKTDNGEPYLFDTYKRFLDPDGYPATSPPWGTLSAIDISSGEYAWRIPFGEYPELVAQGLTDTGSENYGGAVVTAGGLLFIGASIFDRKFRAYDKRNGELLWQTQLPASGVASPATYMVHGRQFIVIAAGGKSAKDTGIMIAFALPQPRSRH
ncbi:MAG: PQQ-binding-like beta-propeller repeat protein [Pseudomonadota bacterium]|nr:PQQ-binding-like beta-propeller repeat protein [Pseudomonadota bacterium]